MSNKQACQFKKWAIKYVSKGGPIYCVLNFSSFTIQISLDIPTSLKTANKLNKVPKTIIRIIL